MPPDSVPCAQSRSLTHQGSTACIVGPAAFVLSQHLSQCLHQPAGIDGFPVVGFLGLAPQFRQGLRHRQGVVELQGGHQLRQLAFLCGGLAGVVALQQPLPRRLDRRRRLRRLVGERTRSQPQSDNQSHQLRLHLSHGLTLLEDSSLPVSAAAYASTPSLGIAEQDEGGPVVGMGIGAVLFASLWQRRQQLSHLAALAPCHAVGQPRHALQRLLARQPPQP